MVRTLRTSTLFGSILSGPAVIRQHVVRRPIPCARALLRHVLDIASTRSVAGATPSQDWGSFMTTMDEDRDHLHEMGYAQELHRGLSMFSNFAISFSIISILAGGMTSFWLGMVTSGPRVITIGWVVVGFFALLVGMAMGEICSAYPTAGGLYYWSAKLARKNQRPVVVVHRLLQPARPDRCHRLGRLRPVGLHRATSSACSTTRSSSPVLERSSGSSCWC